MSPTAHPGLEDLFRYPLMSAIVERRSRRVCRGTSVAAGDLSHQSTNAPAPLSQLEEAKAKAIKENKPLGFVMVWDMFFKEPGNPMGPGSINAMAHFYQVFNDNLVLVFARHEDELGQVPDSVKKGFFGPEEGGFAPNLCAVSPDASEYICEIPMGGANTPGTVREPIFREKIKVIKDYQAAHPAAPAP